MIGEVGQQASVHLPFDVGVNLKTTPQPRLRKGAADIAAASAAWGAGGASALCKLGSCRTERRSWSCRSWLYRLSNLDELIATNIA